MSVGPTQTALLKLLWESPFHPTTNSVPIFRERHLIDTCAPLTSCIVISNRSGRANAWLRWDETDFWLILSFNERCSAAAFGVCQYFKSINLKWRKRKTILSNRFNWNFSNFQTWRISKMKNVILRKSFQLDIFL